MTFLIGIFLRHPDRTEGKRGVKQVNFMIILDRPDRSSYM